MNCYKCLNSCAEAIDNHRPTSKQIGHLPNKRAVYLNKTETETGKFEFTNRRKFRATKTRGQLNAVNHGHSKVTSAVNYSYQLR